MAETIAIVKTAFLEVFNYSHVKIHDTLSSLEGS
jgi:hypothetical protein